MFSTEGLVAVAVDFVLVRFWRGKHLEGMRKVLGKRLPSIWTRRGRISRNFGG